MSEIWKPIVGYEDYYEVSNLGNVRSLDRMVFNGKTYYLKPGRTISIYNEHYSKVRLKANNQNKTLYVHRLVAEVFIGPCPKGLEVCHNNGDNFDNAASNLRYDTHVNNCVDRKQHGDGWSNRIACKNGHEYIEGSFRIEKGTNKRVCKQCQRDRYHKNKSLLTK